MSQIEIKSIVSKYPGISLVELSKIAGQNYLIIQQQVKALEKKKELHSTYGFRYKKYLHVV